ncbi:nucleoside/nucleotide kinase family protein [Paracoccus sp. 1_MG-2023]|uniref:nucleoside/nucleotide kinase family protein n=1 Tax=unclassified Paracoccus (in: a-proteobacteria) TaxID=2688777 RepID=UPI001C081A84|nr:MULTISPECIES: nucleoside/nucleotide kinase family protein [unclassified Paracoccus (in: a-proteobacteria)]MBU2956061.1 nucleoside/nucleotide kinase family protein [Paracoccus sp. C2R09]MDO6669467.1 nucleoside/nucleotide kinase family protein [Paracoccus sp. 1_MG-2023]
MDIESLRQRIVPLLDMPGRRFVAIAGAPGSGKSTLTEALRAGFEQTHPGIASILPMDGFHYDDAVLRDRGRLARKGAPDTFDVGGLVSVIHRLKGPEPEVAVPVFDRKLEISRGSARLIGQGARLILVEGNYLLLDMAPWTALRDMFDLTVMVDVPEAELTRRLRRRWKRHDIPADRIDDKLDGNDLPNGRLVRDRSRNADTVIRWQR